ncbi:MAG: tRNA (guanosine(46)-N7)-methyltransferase TrmB [Planctomycetes bacterium]|nr:tRNA (guanosine(46)-N7)-methyltransferase TrmB [Planctomycetota bacterium]NUQ33633.1 tRNA (guanosine(46)-N7)-methyltransferase TrmB [Planctomycetaceae bacterium]
MSATAAQLELPIQETPYDFGAIFGNTHPVELEVGIGKGRFLIQSAETRPGTNFVGIEWARAYHLMAMERAGKRALTNIRFLRDDALHTFKLALAPQSLSALHVYFPDPWPKTRQRKRRLIQPAFVDLAVKALKDDSLIHLATDHADYFAQMEAVMNGHKQIEVIERHAGSEAPEGVTNYEVKYRQEGRTIHKMVCRTKRM